MTYEDRMPRFVPALLSLLPLFGAAACSAGTGSAGGDGGLGPTDASASSAEGGGATTATCDSTFTPVCQRSCDCGMTACRAAVGGATVAWSTLEQCRTSYCGPASHTASVDLAACARDAVNGTCVSSSPGVTAFALPASCLPRIVDGGVDGG